MRSLLIFTLFFALLAVTTSIKLPSVLRDALPPAIANVLKKPEAKSDDSSVTINGVKLVISNTTATFSGTTEACSKIGSSLPIIHTSEELDAIKSAVPAGSVIWTGLTKKDGVLEWTDGSVHDPVLIPLQAAVENERCDDCGFALDVDTRSLILANKTSEKNQLCMTKKEGSGGFGLKSIPTLFSKLTTDIQNRIEKMKTETEAQLKKLTEGNEGIMGMLMGQQKMMQEILAKIGSKAAEESTSSPSAAATSTGAEALPTPATETLSKE